MTIISLVDGHRDNRVSIDDRGLAYGDGLFETIAIQSGQIQLRTLHIQRLLRGCEKLAINLDEVALNNDIDLAVDEVAASGAAYAVLKIIITRDSLARGYAPNVNAISHRFLTASLTAARDESLEQNGIALRLCQTPIAINPLLAGMKHLCRLENVLARAEWHDEDFFEGVLRDTKNRVVEGTMSNLFLIKNRSLLTPSLKRCGVEGVMRQLIIEHCAPALNFPVTVCDLSVEDMLGADELFICNSLIAILPVHRFEDKVFKIDKVRQLQQAVARQLHV